MLSSSASSPGSTQALAVGAQANSKPAAVSGHCSVNNDWLARKAMPMLQPAASNVNLGQIERLIDPTIRPAHGYVVRDPSRNDSLRTRVRCTNGREFCLVNSVTKQDMQQLYMRPITQQILDRNPIFETHPVKADHARVMLGQGSFARVRLAIDSQTQTLVAARKTYDLSQQQIEQGKVAKLSRQPPPQLQHSVREIQRDIQGINLIAAKIPVDLQRYFVQTFGGVWVDLSSSPANNPGPAGIESKLYLFQEFAAKGDLANKDGQLNVSFTWNIKEQASLAVKLLIPVAIMHACGLRHLDLKPDNYMVTQDNEVKLGDFGFVTDQELYPVTAGTPAYMAPECALAKETGVALETSKIDSFAIGVMLFEWALGRHPLEEFGAINSGLCNRHLRDEPKFMALCESALTAIHSKSYNVGHVNLGLLHPEPSSRLSILEAVPLLRDILARPEVRNL